MKSFWLTALAVAQQEVQLFMKKMQGYGLTSSGHQWSDDPQNMTYMGPIEDLCRPQCAFWVILGSRDAFMKPETRYGLSLLSACVQSRRGPGFPILILQTDGDAFCSADLPTLLRHATILPAADGGTPAKLVSKAYAKAPDRPAVYCLTMAGNPQLGQWFEVRPTQDTWPGIIFGVDEGEIKFQAVGPCGELPKTSTLNFPMQGLKVETNSRVYTAWALQNPITPQTSYYVKVAGFPGSTIFGPFSDAGETELFHIDFK